MGGAIDAEQGDRPERGTPQVRSKKLQTEFEIPPPPGPVFKNILRYPIVKSKFERLGNECFATAACLAARNHDLLQTNKIIMTHVLANSRVRAKASRSRRAFAERKLIKSCAEQS